MGKSYSALLIHNVFQSHSKNFDRCREKETAIKMPNLLVCSFELLSEAMRILLT